MFIKLFKKLFFSEEKDPHIAFYEDTPEPEIPVFRCSQHVKFKKSCPTCLKAHGYG